MILFSENTKHWAKIFYNFHSVLKLKPPNNVKQCYSIHSFKVVLIESCLLSLPHKCTNAVSLYKYLQYQEKSTQGRQKYDPGWSQKRTKLLPASLRLKHKNLIFDLVDGDSPGLKEEDMQASVATLKSIADSLDYEIVQLRERHEKDGLVSEFLLRKKLDIQDFMEIRYFL